MHTLLVEPCHPNAAIRRTAADNEDEFAKEGAVTLANNCYVDDLLKSVNTVKNTTSIIQNLMVCVLLVDSS